MEASAAMSSDAAPPEPTPQAPGTTPAPKAPPMDPPPTEFKVPILSPEQLDPRLSQPTGYMVFVPHVHMASALPYNRGGPCGPPCLPGLPAPVDTCTMSTQTCESDLYAQLSEEELKKQREREEAKEHENWVKGYRAGHKDGYTLWQFMATQAAGACETVQGSATEPNQEQAASGWPHGMMTTQDGQVINQPPPPKRPRTWS